MLATSLSGTMMPAPAGIGVALLVVDGFRIDEVEVVDAIVLVRRAVARAADDASSVLELDVDEPFIAHLLPATAIMSTSPAGRWGPG
jgi:hypothetical protein